MLAVVGRVRAAATSTAAAQAIGALRMHATAASSSAAAAPQRPALVHRVTPEMVEALGPAAAAVYSLENASNKQRIKYRMHELMEKFQRRPGDTGSSEVQIAVLTARIENLMGHIRANKKDVHTRYGLEQLISQRRRLMLYLKRKDVEKYKEVVRELNLRPV
eukprot:tig00000402_g219.t1